MKKAFALCLTSTDKHQIQVELILSWSQNSGPLGLTCLMDLEISPLGYHVGGTAEVRTELFGLCITVSAFSAFPMNAKICQVCALSQIPFGIFMQRTVYDRLSSRLHLCFLWMDACFIKKWLVCNVKLFSWLWNTRMSVSTSVYFILVKF